MSRKRFVNVGEGVFRVLSFGAGVNSTAILCLCKQGKYHVDAVIFADTGGEHPETYEFIEQNVKPLCKLLELPFHIVTRGNLLDEYWEKQIIPFKVSRQCTDKFKIRPIRKFVNQNYKNSVIVLGIDYGERQRAERFRGTSFEYPLIDLKIDREGCKRIIEEAGLPIPRKSGCFYCPFTRKAEWVRLLDEHRPLFLKAEAFEKNCRSYPKHNLTSRKTLESIRLAIENQKSLCDWVELEGEKCVFCHT